MGRFQIFRSQKNPKGWGEHSAKLRKLAGCLTEPLLTLLWLAQVATGNCPPADSSMQAQQELTQTVDGPIPLSATLANQDANGPADPFPSHCTTDVLPLSIQPANSPIVMTVVITNRGDRPVAYATWASYPQARLLKASINNAQGQVHDVLMSNDVGGPGSYGTRYLKSGESIEMPAMIKAFPPGSYTIKVGNGKRASLTVKDDPELGRKWDQDILTRIRKGESFASFVAGKYPRKSLTEALLQDLLSDNEQVVARATGPLSRVPELPDCSAGIVSKAIAKNLARAKQSHDNAAILDSLGWVGANIGTDEALEPILHLSQTENPREAVVLALGKFKHEKAAEQLRRLLNDQHKNIQFRAAQILADRRDPAALDVLLVLAHDPKSTWRMYSFEALLNYRDDPRVKPAIKSGLNDIDSSVRASAKSALRTLHTAKKP